MKAPDGRILLFTGKGGVGKATCAAATALEAARSAPAFTVIAIRPPFFTQSVSIRWMPMATTMSSGSACRWWKAGRSSRKHSPTS